MRGEQVSVGAEMKAYGDNAGERGVQLSVGSEMKAYGEHAGERRASFCWCRGESLLRSCW